MGAALQTTTCRGADGTMQLVAIGEIDMTTVGRFESELQAAIAEADPGATTDVDLRGVEYLDSAAIAVLFTHAERIGQVHVPPLLMRGLTISGLDQVVEVQAAELSRGR